MLGRCDVFIPIDAVTTYFEEESSVVGIIIILLKKPRGARASMSRETLICLFSIDRDLKLDVMYGKVAFGWVAGKCLVQKEHSQRVWPRRMPKQ
jgi:hypothetical protein